MKIISSDTEIRTIVTQTWDIPDGYVESAVEGWNDAIKEIKSRLR